MDHFIPKHLDKAKAAASVRDRLETLEESLVNVLLDVKAAGPGGNPAQESRAEELAASVAELESWASELEG